jgi:hypothetical protein
MSYINNPGAAGGGSGTVTNVGGALTSNAVVLGNGGNDTKVSTGITTNGVAELDLGVVGTSGVLGLKGTTSGTATITAPAVAGTISNPVALSNSLTVGGPQVTISAVAAGNGVLALAGNTSGTATLTAPAVAGTVGNPFVFSNSIQVPVGTAALPAIASGAANTGLWFSAAAAITSVAGVNQTAIVANALREVSSGVIGFSSGDPTVSGNDTGFSRTAAGVVAVGTGLAASKAALIQSGMSQFVTANFTTSGVGTALEAITGLTITVPVLAANWTFHAHLAYSQAVANAAVAFGIQAVTNAPTNIFAMGNQETVITAGVGTFVTGVLATLTTTTATNIVTGTPGATGVNYTCDIHGTCELAASANTIRLLVSTATAADIVTVLRGSYFTFNC